MLPNWLFLLSSSPNPILAGTSSGTHALGKLTALPIPNSYDKGRIMNKRKKKDFEGEGRGERENTGE